MRTPEQQEQDAREAATTLRAMIVAAGILTEQEADMYIDVRAIGLL
jgi:hypothetical protein